MDYSPKKQISSHVRLLGTPKSISGKWMMSTAFSVSTPPARAVQCSIAEERAIRDAFFFVRAHCLVLNVLLALSASLKLSIK